MVLGFITRSKLVPLVILLGAVATASAQSKIGWDVKKGDQLRYRFAQTNVIKTTLQGQDQVIESVLDVDMIWDVTDVKSGVASISMQLDHVKANIKAAGQNLEYDSAGPKSDNPTVQMLGNIYDPMKGEKFTFKLNALGTVNDVAVPQKVVDAAAGSPFAAMADAGSFISPKGIKALMDQVLPKQSETPVAVGGNWKTSLVIPSGPLVMQFNNTYTLVSNDGGKAVIDGKIETVITPDKNSPVPLKLTLDKQSGLSHYEFAGGSINKSSIKQSFDMTIEANNNQVKQSIVVDASMSKK